MMKQVLFFKKQNHIFVAFGVWARSDAISQIPLKRRNTKLADETFAISFLLSGTAGLGILCESFSWR